MVKWSFKDCIKSIVFIICLFIVFEIIINYNKNFIISIKDNISTTLSKSQIVLLLFLIQEIMFIIAMYIAIFKYNINYIKDFKFKSVNFLSILKSIIIGYTLFILINVLLNFLEQYIQIPGFGSQENILNLFGNTTLDIIIAGIVIIFIGPLVEEIFFRGYILQGTIKSFGNIYGNIITSIIFTLTHLELNVFIPIFILSTIMNQMFIKYDSIYPSLIFHMTNNAITFALLVYYF